MQKVPDFRFNKIFERKLNYECKQQGKDSPDWLVVSKIVIKDIILMPFLQNIVWTGLLIYAIKPIKLWINNVFKKQNI